MMQQEQRWKTAAASEGAMLKPPGYPQQMNR